MMAVRTVRGRGRVPDGLAGACGGGAPCVAGRVGLAPGRRIRLHGKVGIGVGGQPTMTNAYELPV
jgi:hypothetical protein